MTLKDWYGINRSNKEKLTTILDKLDISMKELHRRGYYVVNFHPNNILINYPSEDSEDEVVSFPTSGKAPSELMERIIQQNVFMLAALDVGLYTGFLDNMFNFEVLRDNFDQYAFLLPEDRRDYYQHVLVYGKPEYQVDYYIARQGGSESSNSNSMGLSKVKETPYGKLYASQEEAGRVNVLGLSTFIVAILLITVIGWILFLLK